MKKDSENLIQPKLLFEAQDGEENYTEPGLLFYCKRMPACLLVNQYTPLGIVNGARAIVHRIVPHIKNKSISFGNITANEK